MSKSKRRLGHFGRQNRFESLEPRIVLDTQIGTVTMPYDGYLTVAVYDSNNLNQPIRTLIAQQPEQAGTVTLVWDGKDQAGRVVDQSGTYTWKALTSQVNPLDQGAVGDTESNTTNFNANTGYFTKSLATSVVPGTAGDVGGTFAKNDDEHYFGDTSLSSVSLSSPISASGKLFFSDIANMGTTPFSVGAMVYTGHFSASTADSRREFIGIEYYGQIQDRVTARVRFYGPNGNFLTNGSRSDTVDLVVGAGYFNWDYAYDPTLGANGRVTAHIYTVTTSYTLTLDLTSGDRSSGAAFDSFGMGTAKLESSTGDNTAMNGKFFIDDVTYTGHTGLVDFNAASAPSGWTGVGNSSSGNSYGFNTSSKADGSLYMFGHLQEASLINKISATGDWLWASGGPVGFGGTADETYIYVSTAEKNTSGVDEYRIYRYFARDSGPAPFAPGMNYVVVNNEAGAQPATDPSPSTQLAYRHDKEQWRTWTSTWGMAADGYRIWVSNYRENYVKVYDRATGAQLGKYTITKPLSIAVDTASSTSSTVWIANNGNQVTPITFTNSTGTFSAGTSITGLSDPTGLTLGGPNHHLFVAESGTTHIREYTTSGTLVSGAGTLGGVAGTFGSFGSGGPITTSQFDWTSYGATTSLSIDTNGILSVLDGFRIQRFYSTTGGGHNAGDLYDSLIGEAGWNPNPYTATFNASTGTFSSTPGMHYLSVGQNVYQIDPDYTGGPRAGWSGDGTWRLVERYTSGVTDQGPGMRVMVMDGATPRELRVYCAGLTNMTIFTVDGSGQRLSTMLGSFWTGPDRRSYPPYNPVNGAILGGKFAWRDNDGDGQIDWNGTGTGTDGEVTWSIPLGQSGLLSGFFHPTVDSSGNIWYADAFNNLIKVPFEGFTTASNGQRNPVYNWASQVTVVPYQNGFVPYQVRISGNGDIYVLGVVQGASVGVNTMGGAPGGDWIARYNSSGVLQALIPSSDYVFVTMALDPNAPDPVVNATESYFVTGETVRPSLYTKDGLLVAQFTDGSGQPIGSTAGTGAPTGWMDTSEAIAMFTDPTTHRMYVYAENSQFGNNTRWRVDGLDTIQRRQGDFSYVATPATLVGNWAFDSNVNDLVGINNGTFSGGTASYSAGQIGNALNLDGVDDYVQIPYATNPSAYTMSAWVKVDTTGSMNIISRGNADPGAISHQIRINANRKFEHYTYDGNVRLITGTTTVQTNTWYNVTVTATNGGQMHLYVNGVEEGTPTNVINLWTGGDRFYVGKGNSVGSFDGLMDDLRIYDRALTPAQVLEVYNKTTLPLVTITASDATASEETNDPGTFLIRRDNTNGSLVVSYTISGTATNNSDYSTIVGSVTIPSGSVSAVVTVAPLSDSAVEGNETVILTLSTSANYSVGAGTLGSATVTIVDNDIASVPPNGRWPFEDKLLSSNTGREFGMSDYAGSNNGTSRGTKFFDAPISQPWYYGPATYVTGQSGKAVSLDGRDDSILIPYSTDATAYTIAAWVKPDINISRQNGTYMNILARTDASFPNVNGVGTVSEQIRINGSGQFEHYLNDGTSEIVTGTTTVVADGAHWYHVAIVATNNGMMRLYVNGVEEGTAKSIGTLWTGGDRFNVGVNAPDGMQYYHGAVDDLQIYDAPLTASQIQGIYNQASTVTVSATDSDAAEPNNTGTFTVTRTGTSGALVVNYAISGTATSGSDFSALVGSVTISNGSSTATVVVTPLDDSTFEPDETVVLTITSNPNYSIGAPNSAAVTIHDNEATVTVVATDAEASEPGTDKGVYTFTRSAVGAALVVNYTMSGSAGNDTDYSTLNGAVTIPSGSSTVTLTITPKDDSSKEGDETAILTISSSANYAVGTPNSATVTIHDDEPTVTVVATDANASEPGGAAVGIYTFTRTNAGAALVVNYSMSGTATNNSDYSTLVGSVTIPSGSSTVDLTIVPKDDTLAEGDETAILTISSSSSYFVGTPNSATVTIADDEPIVSVVATDSSASEQGPDPGVFTFMRVGTTSGNLVVNYTVGGTATGTSNTDYTALSGAVTIPSGSSTATVTVNPVNDSLAESSETVTVTISSSANYFIGASNSAMVTIADNESTVSVLAVDASAAEQGADPGVFTFTRTNPDAALVVNYAVTGTATGTSNTDYTALAGSVTFPAGSSTVSVSVIPVDDSTAEGNETVILTISSNSAYFVGSPNSDTVNIADNEATVTVSATDTSAAEQSANVGVFTFTRTNTSGTLVVNYAVSGTATGASNTDYTALPGSVTFSAGSSTANVTVTPVDDAVGEGDETVIVTISSNANYFVGTPNSATVTIADNDAVVNSQAGGTFAQNDNESYFGDTGLSQSYTLSSTITASGTLTVSNADTMGYSQKFFVGHFSQSTASNRKEYIGIELFKGDVTGYVGAQARIYQFNGEYYYDAYSSTYVNLTSAGGPYTFTYTYDPNYEADSNHAGPEGRLTLQIAGQTLYAVNSGAHRDAGSTFDGFGMGITTLTVNGNPTGDNPANTAKMFLDDVQYSGHTGTVNFNSNPGWTGVGNISDGNTYGWNLVNVNATDANAAEQGADPGVFSGIL